MTINLFEDLRPTTLVLVRQKIFESDAKGNCWRKAAWLAMSIENMQGYSNQQVLAPGLSPMARIRCAKTWKAKHVPYVPALTTMAKTVSHNVYCQRIENAVGGELVSHCSWPFKELFDRYFRFRLPTIFREILQTLHQSRSAFNDHGVGWGLHSICHSINYETLQYVSETSQDVDFLSFHCCITP